MFGLFLVATLEKKNTYDPELSEVDSTRTDLVSSIISNVRVTFLHFH